MHPWISKNLLYLPTQAIRRERVTRHLADLERSQWLSRDALQNEQDARIRALVPHAVATIPHYRRRFAEHGVDPASIRGAADLAKLPVLEKAEARRAGAELVSETPSGRIDGRKTSGSTGLPMPIRKPRDTIARIRAIWYRYSRWYGIDIGHRQGRFLGHPVDWRGVLKEDVQDFILNKDRLDPVYLTPEKMRRYWARTLRRPLDYVYGYPSAMEAFARFLLESGEDPKRSGARALFCTGETLYPFQASYLEEAWGVPAVNEWGCTESGVLAFPCPEERRMHLSADNVVVELLVGDRPAASGEAGEVVVTDLHSDDAPLIRYRLGDVAVADDGSPCACGRSLPTIARVEGRTSQMISLPDGRQVHSEAFAYIGDSISAADASVERFRVRRTGERSFVLQLVGSAPLGEQTFDKLREIAQRVFGEEADLEFEQVSELPRDPSGKLRYYVSDLDSPAQGGPSA